MPTGAETLTDTRFAGTDQFTGSQNFDAAGAGKEIANKIRPGASIPMSEMGIVGKTFDKTNTALSIVAAVPFLAMPEAFLRGVGNWKYTPFKGAFNWVADKVKPIGKPAHWMEHTTILGEKIPKATTKIVNGVEETVAANFTSQKAEKIAASVGAKIENSGVVKSVLGSARQKSVAATAKNWTSAAGHANLSNVAITGAIAAGHAVTAIGNYHDAKNLISGLKAMVHDATGKKTSLFGLLVKGDAADLGVSRTRVFLNLIIPTLGQGAVAATDIHMMRSNQVGMKNIIVSATMQMGVAMVSSLITGAIRPTQVDDYLQLRNAQARGQQLSPQDYADFISKVAPGLESVDRDGVKTNALAVKYANDQVPLAQVLRDVTNQAVFLNKGAQALQWQKQTQGAVSVEPSELTLAQERLNGRQENIGQHTGAYLASKTGKSKAAASAAPGASGDVIGSATANLAVDRANAMLQNNGITA